MSYQRIELSNGEILEFPQEMSDDQITQAIYKEYPQYSPEVKKQNQFNQLKQEHPYLMSLAEKLQDHPKANELINKSSPYAEHFNRATQGTGLPNLSKGFFTMSDKLLRGLANMTPTGLAPSVNISDPGFSQAQIPEVNSRIQRGSELIGNAAPLALGEAPVILARGGREIANLPWTKRIAARPIEEAKTLIKHRNIPNLPPKTEIIEEAEALLPNQPSYKRLIDRARNGDHEAIFALQSDLRTLGSSHSKNPFSAAERAKGRDMLKAREALHGDYKSDLANLSHKDIADLISHGQNRYRQHMMMRVPALGAISALIGHHPAATLYRKIMGAFD